jgi:uridine kinase
MRMPITPATTLWRELRDEVRQHYPRGRVVLGVDGTDPHAFADGLAEAFAEEGAVAVRASLAAFLRPRAERTPADPYDTATFRRVLLDPFRDAARTGGTAGFQLAAWDEGRDAPVAAQWTTAPRDAVLVVDGAGLQGPGLAGVWNWSVWLDDGDPAAAPSRPGTASAASAIVDVARPDRPVRVFRDFC